MLEFDEALGRVLESAPLLDCEPVELAEACGRVLCETVHASAPLPPFDYSAMDGYALDPGTLGPDPPYDLPVRGESRTGDAPGVLETGSARRIFTGAPLPRGADCVVLQEDVSRSGDAIVLGERPVRGANIRRAGEDLSRGAEALARGTRLNPFHVGLAAAVDRSALRVSKRPRVIVVATGDELRAPGSPGRPGSIPESNSFAVAALARGVGAEVRIEPRLADDLAVTRRRLAALLDDCELLVTIGGVSVGDYDFVRPALEAAGCELAFWKVAIRPGKPLVLGQRGRTRVLGLPGNPVSAQITFLLFGLPLLRAMQGEADSVPKSETAQILADIRQRPGRRGYYRGRLSGGQVTPLVGQSSGATTSLAAANALIVIPGDAAGAKAGDRVEVLRLSELL